MPKIKVKVDPDLCIGAGSCAIVDPQTFEMNDENKAYVLDHGKNEDIYEREMEVTDAELADVLLAAESCPVLAVVVYDDEGNQIYPK
jgi:ferredoxin